LLFDAINQVAVNEKRKEPSDLKHAGFLTCESKYEKLICK